MKDNIINIVSIILAIVGIFMNIKAEKRIRLAKSISWDNIQSASKFLWKKIKKDSFTPQIILTPGQKGGIIAQLIADFYSEEIPILTGFIQPYSEKPIITNDYITIKTSKWNVYIPCAIYNKQEINKLKILIVDDFVMSGDFLTSMKNDLINKGYSIDNIKSAMIAVTQSALDANKGPDYYWKVVNDRDFDFPWGKAK